MRHSERATIVWYGRMRRAHSCLCCKLGISMYAWYASATKADRSSSATWPVWKARAPRRSSYAASANAVEHAPPTYTRGRLHVVHEFHEQPCQTGHAGSRLRQPQPIAQPFVGELHVATCRRRLNEEHAFAHELHVVLHDLLLTNSLRIRACSLCCCCCYWLLSVSNARRATRSSFRSATRRRHHRSPESAQLRGLRWNPPQSQTWSIDPPPKPTRLKCLRRHAPCDPHMGHPACSATARQLAPRARPARQVNE
jgi:hypothetical protein